MLSLRILGLTKADEGLHLVRRPTHRLHPVGGFGHVGIGQNRHKIRLVPQSPQQTIHQVEPILGPMLDQVFRRLEKGARRGEGAVLFK